MGCCRLVHFLRPFRILCNSALSSFSSCSPFFQKSSKLLLFSPFSSLSSSAALQNPNTNDSNFNIISGFLLRDCGFAQSRLAILQKRHPRLWRRTSIEKARQIVDVFRSYGVSDSQLEKILFSTPSALSTSDAESLKNKLRVIESFGFTKEDIADFVSRSPWIIKVKDVNRNIQSLLSAFRNAKSFLEAVKRRPAILVLSRHGIEMKIKCLKQSGLDDLAISSLVYRCPSILQTKPEKILRIIKYLRDIGVSEHSKVFQGAFDCMLRGGCSLDEKERILAKAGLSEEQIKEVFRKCPMNLSNSVEKIRKVMDYLISTAGLSPDVIVKYPFILGLSIEKRIKPRHEVFKYISTGGSSRRVKSLGRFIQMGEKDFMKKFVEGNPNAEQLLKIYGTVSSANTEKLGQS